MSLRWRHEGWRKLYVREEGSFAQLPLYTRAFAAELLKIVDSQGRIDCMGKDPSAAIAWRLGATRGDRRLIRRDVKLLLADGYLVRDEGTGDLIMRNFLNAHPHLAIDEAGGAQVIELPRAAAAMPPPTTTPGATGTQLGLFGWAPHESAAVDPGLVLELVATAAAALAPPRRDDPAATVPRRSTQPAEIAAFVSEDQRRQDPEREKKPPPGDEVGARRVAHRLAEQHEDRRAAVARELDILHIPIPISDVAIRITGLLDREWTEDAIATAIDATAHEARTKRTLLYFNGADNLKPDALKRAIARSPARRAPPRVVATAPPSQDVARAAPASARVALDDLQAMWKDLGLSPTVVAALGHKAGT